MRLAFSSWPDTPSRASSRAATSRETPAAAKKLGEEAVETVIAAVAQGPDALAAESADLLYHWLALMAASGVSLDAVAEKLEAREGTSGIAEKASRA